VLLYNSTSARDQKVMGLILTFLATVLMTRQRLQSYTQNCEINFC